MIVLLYTGAAVTLVFGLAFLIDCVFSLRVGEPWVAARELLGAALMLAGFAGFYLSIVGAP